MLDMIGHPTMSSTDQDLDLLFGGTTRDPDEIIRRLRSSDPGDLTLPKPLPSPRQLQEDPDLIWVRYDGIVMLRQVSQFTIHDTPVASLYRICEFICADQPNQVMLETNYFWSHNSWSLCSIPDPCDDDDERYAMLASLVESLVIAFNYRLSLGFRRDGALDEKSENCPPWVSRVPALRDTLHLKRQTGDDFGNEEYSITKATDPFSKRNIEANAGNLFSF
jgi:hypothetical protein